MKENPVATWYVIGGVVDLIKSKPFEFSNNQFDSQSMLTQANERVCHQEWSTFQNQYPGNEYLYGSCLFPAYYAALINDGYGIDMHKTINFLPSATDWTLGAVLSMH